jgi:hypothetical protein
MAKKKAQAPSHAALATVRQLVKNVSAASVKSWLKSQGLTSSASNREQLENKIASLIDTGELTVNKFRDAVIGIEESGGKRVHLFEVPDTDLDPAKIRAALKKANLQLSNDRDFAATAAKTTLVYILLTDNELRMKWSENHQKPETDLDDMTVKLKPVKKVVVFRFHIEPKRAEIHYDNPEIRHPHGPSKGACPPSLYFDYYRTLVEELLEIKLVPSELRGVLKQLIEETPPVAKVKVQDHTNQQGNRIRVSARKNDVREDKDWQAMHTQNGQEWAYDSHSFYWISAASKESLKRDLFSALDADEVFVRVPADCNEEEITYAIEQIRKRQATTSKAVQAN